MSAHDAPATPPPVRRRVFLQTSAVAASGFLVPAVHASTSARRAPEELQIALLGAGYQGRILLSAAVHIPGIRIAAICDIWKSAQNYARNFLELNQQPNVPVYDDYRDLLAQQRGLSAVLIATPDFVHAEQTVACLQAGLHVYCEPMMAHTLPAARTMVEAARRTGRLLQIGLQRRSHLRYRHAVDKLLREAQLPGRLHVAQLQWAQSAKDLHGWPRRSDIPVDVLRQHGYADMTQFRNWIWFPTYCAGPFGAFATQQLDVCHWFFGSNPRSVTAVGDRGFYPDRPPFDSVFGLYEFPYQDRTVRVSATLLTTTGTEGARQFERFLGDQGCVQLAENPRWTRVGREPTAAAWDEWVRRNYVVRQEAVAAHAAADEQADVHVSGELEPYRIPIEVTTLPCQAHVENFVAAVRGEASLNCPAEAAFSSHVTTFKTLEAAQSHAELSLTADDYAV